MRIYSIFSSLNGEVCSMHQGSMCTFIRLSGCSVGCTYCDTQYAQDKNSGIELDLQTILDSVRLNGNINVTITGGEPMEQKEELIKLVQLLLGNNYNISIETSGEVPFECSEIASIYTDNVHFVTDIKLDTQNHFHHYDSMWNSSEDFFKIVIGDELDVIKATHIKNEIQRRGCRAKFAFSPMYGKVEPIQLLNWIQSHGINDVIVNLQIHKILGLVEDASA